MSFPSRGSTTRNADLSNAGWRRLSPAPWSASVRWSRSARVVMLIGAKTGLETARRRPAGDQQRPTRGLLGEPACRGRMAES